MTQVTKSQSQRAYFAIVCLMSLFLISCSGDEHNGAVADTSRLAMPESYLLVNTANGLIAVDPADTSQQFVISQSYIAAIIIPQHQRFSNGKEIAFNRYAVFVDNGHFYRVDLSKTGVNPLQAQQISSESGIDRICRMSSYSNFTNNLDQAGIIYELPGPDALCGYEPGVDFAAADDNVEKVISLSMGTENIDANMPQTDSGYNRPPRTAAELNGTEFRFYITRIDVTGTKLTTVLLSRLSLENGSLLWYLGEDVSNPTTLFSGVNNFSFISSNFLRVDKNLYRFDPRTGLLGPKIYTFVDDVALFDYASPYGVRSLPQYVFFDAQHLYLLTDNGINYPVQPLGNETYQVDSFVFDRTGDNLIIADVDFNDLTSGMCYIVSRSGGQRKSLLPEGYNTFLNGRLPQRLDNERYLVDSEDLSNKAIINGNGTILNELGSNIALSFYKYDRTSGILVDNYQGSGHLVLYDAVNNIVEVDFGEQTISNILYGNSPNYLDVGVLYSVLSYQDLILLYDQTKPGQSLQIMPNEFGISMVDDYYFFQ